MAAPTAAAPAPPRCSNLYWRRLAASPRPCTVCLRPSAHFLVSASLPTADFFAVCPSHLEDRHFATRVGAPPPPSAPERMPEKVSKEEIERVKREWEEREKARKEKASTDKDKDKVGKGSEKDEGKGWLASLTSLATSVAPSAPSPAPIPAPAAAAAPPAPSPAGAHEQYTLHRDFFAIRLDEHKKRLALARAKELKLPAVPRSMPALPSAP